MIIGSLEHELSVIRIIDSGEETELLLCRDLRKKKEQECLVLRILDQEQIRRQMPLLCAQAADPAFGDFLGCFSAQGALCCLFRWKEGTLLSEKLAAEPFSLRERLTAGRNLFAHMMELNMDPRIQQEALRDENLLLDDTLAVHFNYILRELPGEDDKESPVLYQRIGEILRLLFERELEQKVSPELKAFIEAAEQGQYPSYVDLYREYSRLLQFLLEELEAGRLRPHSILYALWERIKGLSRFVRPAIAVLLVTAALIYLIWSLAGGSSSGNTAARHDFNQIGTVNISEPEAGVGK